MTRTIRKDVLDTWASFLLDHSLGGVTKEDIVMLKGEHITWPLLSVLQDKIFSAGGLADVNLVAPDNNRGQVWGSSIARHGTVEQIMKIPAWHRERYESMTKYIEVLGSEDPSLFSNLPEETMAAITRADEPFKNIRLSKPWVLTLFPTPAFAAIEGMSLEEYTDVIVEASTQDPGHLEKEESPLADLLEQGSSIEIVSHHPTRNRRLRLSMDISDRFAIKSFGKRNFPDGEVFTSPSAVSVEGEIYFDLPVYYNGQTISGIYLKLEEGKITEYSSRRGGTALSSIIETDPGSHRMGEVAFGMNRGLKRALKHPLFIEKVGGTMHMAIGASYPECYVSDPSSPGAADTLDRMVNEGIMNRSAQHVDIVLDFRPGGCGRDVYVDGKALILDDSLWKPAD